VLEEACRQLRDWQLQYPANRNLVVSVNLSTKQLREPGMLESVTSVLDRTGLQPEHLRIEISERAVTWDLATALDQLHALRALGIRLALDDFGSGHAAIAALRRLPIDTLKIDRSLVDALGGSERDTTLVQAVISLAKILGLTVTAEGIETPEQARQLRAFGCDFGQGTYFGDPVPAEEFTRFLSNDFSDLLHTR
jgi:EAL domain-containing protein (putative c-di-GMP-specific phosphodiesterase class I)